LLIIASVFIKFFIQRPNRFKKWLGSLIFGHLAPRERKVVPKTAKAPPKGSAFVASEAETGLQRRFNLKTPGLQQRLGNVL
jgi:hypothetical protein